MVHLDIIDPLPIVHRNPDPYLSRYMYLLTCIDRATRLIEVQSLTEITSRSLADAFISLWIASFGFSLYDVTIRGSPFESKLLQELSKIVGFYRLWTTAYYQQTIGLIERAHHTLKTVITREEFWINAISTVLISIRSTPNEPGLPQLQPPLYWRHISWLMNSMRGEIILSATNIYSA